MAVVFLTSFFRFFLSVIFSGLFSVGVGSSFVEVFGVIVLVGGEVQLVSARSLYFLGSFILF
jgi:hypothetical protein